MAFSPVLGSQVPGFRILQRVGQPLVAVVANMALAIVLERQPQAEIEENQKSIEPWPTGGMSMHHLMLQGPLPGHQIGTQRKEQPSCQMFVKPGDEGEASIDQKGNQDRRPADGPRPAPWRLVQVSPVVDCGIEEGACCGDWSSSGSHYKLSM